MQAPQEKNVAGIALENLVKSFGAYTAVSGITLDIRDGEFLIMVGPSGCGKTTTLNMISGLEVPTSGKIVIGDTVVNDLEPGERGLGMVFQDLALFPHMTVFENIAFGLRVRKMPAAKITELVGAAAEAMHITPLLAKLPRQCSGGESQRVALARTIVTNPAVFLMDEPLSSLDAKLRVDMRTELKRLHERLKATFIYVTHDQAEAMTMADRIVVMSKGRIEQLGTPLEIYDRPATQFVAGFFGTPTMNFLEGVVEAGPDGPRFRGAGLEQAVPLPSPPTSTEAKSSSACARSISSSIARLRYPARPVCCSRSATRRSCTSTPGRASRWSRKLRPARTSSPARRCGFASRRSIAICSMQRAASG